MHDGIHDNMPFDTANNNNNNAGRPLKPVLATRRNVKSPVTPRLAASATPPLTRKPTHSDLASAIRKCSSREQLSTPVQAFLNNNVTPRSSSRKSRVDSAQSTPDGGTPTIARPNSAASSTQAPRNGAYPFNNASQARPKSVVGSQSASNSPLIRSSAFVNTGIQSPELPPGSDLDSKFFRANDARSPELAPIQKKGPTFFYANGQQEDEGGRPAAAPSPPLSAVSARSGRNHFFRANGGEIDDIPPLPSPPLVAPSPKPLPVETLQRAPAFFRPPSSESIHLSYRKGASQVIKPSNRANALPLLSPANFQPQSANDRSGSTDALDSQQNKKPHDRTSSLSSIDSLPSSRKSSIAAAENASYFGLSPLVTNSHLASGSGSSTPQRGGSAPASAIIPDPATITSAPQHRASNNSSPDDCTKPALSLQPRSRNTSASISVPQSPTRPNSSGPQSLQQLSELAANARRERKVLDLEISNSSLLAINRQLEREVRKQKAELRRFRRLTRAGRLSSLSILNSQTAEGDENNDGGDEGASDGAADEDEDLSLEDENFSEDEDSTDDSALSSSALAVRDEKKLAKDSKRLQIDLSRHRELLIDSQKMNQALRRCLAWTEDLIKDGKKALEYRVRVDEVQLGGRVLERENVGGGEAGESEDHRLVSAWSPTSMPHLEASRDGILGLGIMRTGSWQSETLTSPEEQLEDTIADLPVCGAEDEPLGEG